MTVEKTGAGEAEKFRINDLPISREQLNELCAQYFSKQSLEQLWLDLEKYGRVHIAFAFVNNSLRLDRAYKKIAALERRIAELTLKDVYRTA